MRVAKERKSSVLASNAIHHRVDSLTSIVALLAIGGSHVFNGAAWLDPVGGLLVAVMVIQAGYGNTVSAVYELCDAAVGDDIKASVKGAAAKALTSEELEVREVQGTKAGQNYLMEVEVAVPSDWTLQRMNQVEEAVRERIGSKVRGVRRVRVRFTPKEVGNIDFTDEFIPAEVSPRSSPEPDAGEEVLNHDHASQSSPTSKGDRKLRKRA